MTRTIACALLLCAALPTAAQSPARKGCLLEPAQLAKVLGGSFAPGKEEGDQGMMGVGCSYKGSQYSVWLLTSRPGDFGATAEQALKLTDPGQWNAVPGDPDGLRVATQKPDVPPFPSIAYERKGTLTRVRIVGPWGSGAKALAELNGKLGKLPRVP